MLGTNESKSTERQTNTLFWSFVGFVGDKKNIE